MRIFQRPWTTEGMKLDPYRAAAYNLRRRAAAVDRQDLKAQLLSMANDWERLAELAEERARQRLVENPPRRRKPPRP